MKIYSGPADCKDFIERFRQAMSLHYPRQDSVPELLVNRAWEILGDGRDERFVTAALRHLEGKFRRDRAVDSLQDAREAVYAAMAKDQVVTRNQARGGMGAIIADSPQLTDAGRAYMAVTRWCMREIAELGRQGKEIGNPERQAVHEAHARFYSRIDAGDREEIRRWLDWTDSENQLAAAQKANRREVRCA